MPNEKSEVSVLDVGGKPREILQGTYAVKYIHVAAEKLNPHSALVGIRTRVREVEGETMYHYTNLTNTFPLTHSFTRPDLLILHHRGHDGNRSTCPIVIALVPLKMLYRFPSLRYPFQQRKLPCPLMNQACFILSSYYLCMVYLIFWFCSSR